MSRRPPLDLLWAAQASRQGSPCLRRYRMRQRGQRRRPTASQRHRLRSAWRRPPAPRRRPLPPSHPPRLRDRHRAAGVPGQRPPRLHPTSGVSAVFLACYPRAWPRKTQKSAGLRRGQPAEGVAWSMCRCWRSSWPAASATLRRGGIASRTQTQRRASMPKGRQPSQRIRSASVVLSCLGAGASLRLRSHLSGDCSCWRR